MHCKKIKLYWWLSGEACCHQLRDRFLDFGLFDFCNFVIHTQKSSYTSGSLRRPELPSGKKTRIEEHSLFFFFMQSKKYSVFQRTDLSIIRGSEDQKPFIIWDTQKQKQKLLFKLFDLGQKWTIVEGQNKLVWDRM